MLVLYQNTTFCSGLETWNAEAISFSGKLHCLQMDRENMLSLVQEPVGLDLLLRSLWYSICLSFGGIICNYSCLSSRCYNVLVFSQFTFMSHDIQNMWQIFILCLFSFKDLTFILCLWIVTHRITIVRSLKKLILQFFTSRISFSKTPFPLHYFFPPLPGCIF